MSLTHQVYSTQREDTSITISHSELNSLLADRARLHDVMDIVHNAHLTERERIVLMGMIAQTGNYPSSPQQYRTQINLADLGALFGAEVGYREGWAVDKYDNMQRHLLAKKAGVVVRELSRLGYAPREVIRHANGRAEVYNLGIQNPQSHIPVSGIRLDVDKPQTHIPVSGIRVQEVESIPHVVESSEPQSLIPVSGALVRSIVNTLSTDNKVVPNNLVTSEVSTILNGNVAPENGIRQEVDREPEPTAVSVPSVAELLEKVRTISDTEELRKFYFDTRDSLATDADRASYYQVVSSHGKSLKKATKVGNNQPTAVQVPDGGIDSTTYTPSSASPPVPRPPLHIAEDHSENVDRSELADEMRSAFNMFRYHKVRVVYQEDGNVDIGENLPSFMVNLVEEYRDRINQWIVSHYNPGDVIVAGKGSEVAM